MARIFTSGAEIDAGIASPNTLSAQADPDGQRGGTGTNTRDTSVFRSGAASWKFDSGAAGNTSNCASALNAFVDGRSYFLRAYILVASAPTAATRAMSIDANSITAQMRTDGALELTIGGAVQGSPSGPITDSSWHRVELSGVMTATSTWTAAELLVDGASIATWSGSRARSGTTITWGWGGLQSASRVMNVDDVALNDSTGAVNNSYPGPGAVVLLKPTADSAVGSGWRLGTGTTISGNSAKTAVSNTPPLGVADLAVGSDVKQIRNAASAASNSYDATMTTYTAAGIGASDTINAVVPWVVTSAPVVTSAKLGTVGVASNPVIANVNLSALGTSGAFWGGLAAAGYGSGWKWSAGTTTEAPTVTKGTAPVMRITQVTASTLIAMVCGMFIYVDYTPAPPPATKKPRIVSSRVPAMRAALR